MIIQLVTAVALAVLAILSTWAIFRTVKRPMPRYLIPIVASATVIGYGVYSEYTWESRTLAQMPASVQVVHRLSGTSVFSPWSYVLARTDRMSVVDTAAKRTHPQFPNYVMVDLLVLQRFNPVVRARQFVDCAGSRRADLVSEPVFDAQGLPVDLQWNTIPEGHDLIRVACDVNRQS